MINKLHQNVIWALRGNFVSVPTDCPQRDERLGWTADINVFTPTASFLFDTCGFLSGWLNDLAVDTIRYGGVVPEVVPYVPLFDGVPRPSAIWADTIIITPWDVYTYFDDKQVLERQWESMCLWLHKGLPRQANGLWEPSDVAFGDWLDPNAVGVALYLIHRYKEYSTLLTAPNGHQPSPHMGQPIQCTSPTSTSSTSPAWPCK